jgi:ApbE superfamily uncharacterized protein (UPF0280 family)
MRRFRTFKYRDASYRISADGPDELYSYITERIAEIREELETYIKFQPEFLKSLVPIEPLADAPDSVRLMCSAAKLTGIGPMAAVAGTTAELAAKRSEDKARSFGVSEIIIENGGDIFILPLERSNPVIAGIFSGLQSKFSSLALKIEPGLQGTALCSSSGRMGHSLSFGDCDLCTVVSSDASLADAAATLGGNMVKTEADLSLTAKHIAAIKGVDGVLLIKNDKLAVAGQMPEIIRHEDPAGLNKITGKFIQ